MTNIACKTDRRWNYPIDSYAGSLCSHYIIYCAMQWSML